MIDKIDSELLRYVFNDNDNADLIVELMDEYIGNNDFATFFKKASDLAKVSEEDIRKNYMSEFLRQQREEHGSDTVSILDGIGIFTLNLFKDCINVGMMIIPDSVTFIGEGSFENSDLTEFRTLDGTSLNGVGKGAFKNCSELKVVDLSHTKIEVIKSGTFENCSNLHTVIFPKTLKEIESGAFKDTMVSSGVIDFRSYTDGGDNKFDPEVPILEYLFYKNHASAEQIALQ